MKTLLTIVLVVVVGALIGNLLGGFLLSHFSDGFLHELAAKKISAGLNATKLDLRIVELTFGAILKLDVPSVLGIALAGIVAKFTVR